MKMVFAVQILIILSFIFSLRMQVWKTSLNSFIFICGLFILTVTREIPYFRAVWVEYHTSLMGITLLLVMLRLSYQSFYTKYKAKWCSDCTNYNRRATDIKE